MTNTYEGLSWELLKDDSDEYGECAETQAWYVMKCGPAEIFVNPSDAGNRGPFALEIRLNIWGAEEVLFRGEMQACMHLGENIASILRQVWHNARGGGDVVEVQT